MRIVGARWTPAVNVLDIGCECGRQFEHRADHWIVRCSCGRSESIEELRNLWLTNHRRPENE